MDVNYVDVVAPRLLHKTLAGLQCQRTLFMLLHRTGLLTMKRYSSIS